MFLVTFGVCLLTTCPTVSYDDTGEFCVAALQLGVPHPPGYPLYVLLMAIARHLPAGSFAFRLNLLAGVWAACAAAMLLALWRRTERGPLAVGWVASLAAVFAAGPWSQATTAKGGVYLLNASLAAALLWVPRSDLRVAGRAAAAGLIAGLALANHWMTAVAFLPALAIVLVAPPVPGAGRRWALAGTGLAIGLSVCVVLPLCAIRHPFLNWSSTENAGGFAFSVGRRQYLGGMADESKATAADRLAAIRGAIDGAAPAGALVVLAAAGVAGMASGFPREALSALSVLGALYAGLLAYGPLRAGAPWYFEIFSVTGTMLLAWLAVAGLAAASGWAAIRSGRSRAAPGAAVVVTLLAAAILVRTAGPARWRACDRSREYLTWDLAVNLDAQTAGRGVLFANSDVVVFGNWYHWLVEDRREGAVVVPAPLLPMAWVARSFVSVVPGLRAPLPAPNVGAEAIPALARAWEQGNAPRFATYTFNSETARAAWPEASPRRGVQPVRLVEHGWVYRVTRGAAARTAAPAIAAWRSLRLRGLYDGEVRREARKLATIQPIAFSGLLTMGEAAASGPSARPGEGTPGGVGRRALERARGMARSDADLSRVESALGMLAAGEGRYGEAASRFERAANLARSPSALMNLVMLHMRMGRTAQAVAAGRRLLKEAPDSAEAREAAELVHRLERQGGLKR